MYAGKTLRCLTLRCISQRGGRLTLCCISQRRGVLHLAVLVSPESLIILKKIEEKFLPTIYKLYLKDY